MPATATLSRPAAGMAPADGAADAGPPAAALPGLNRLLITLFVMSLLVPGHIHIGTITLGMPRLLLLLTIIPCTILLLRGRIVATDIFMALFTLWMNIAVLVNGGMANIQFVALQSVEVFGAYVFGRTLVTGLAGFRLFWRTTAIAMIFVLPFAVFELITERFLLYEIFDPFIDTFDNATAKYPKRLGFDRVQGNFEHPILFGVFWGLGFAIYWVVFRSLSTRVLITGICGFMVMMSLSSGAYLVVLIQIALMGWALVTGNRWKTLISIGAIFFLVIEALSDRSALVALSTRLAFSANTAYWRVLIFEFGMQNVNANPIFGLGLRDWARPGWLTNSVDNQWLLVTMRGGYPGFFLMITAMGTMLWALIRRRDLPTEASRYRQAYVIVFISMFVALGTVAVWSATQAFLWMFLAMGVNLALLPRADQQSPAAGTPPAADMAARGTRRYSRFDGPGAAQKTARPQRSRAVTRARSDPHSG